MSIDVGQKLVLVTPMRNQPARVEWVVVTKVGRKWASIVADENHGWNRGRFDIDSFRLDSQFGQSSTLHASLEEYQETTRLHQLWSQAQRLMRDAYNRPGHLTIDHCEQIIAILTPPEPKS